MDKMLLLALALLVPAGLAGCVQQVFGGGPVMPQDYLRDDDRTEWVIEVDYVGGVRPSQGVLDFTRGRIAPLVHKPDGVSFVVDDELPQASGKRSTKDLLELSKQYQNIKTEGDRVVTHLIFVDGGSADDTSRGRVLGVTIGFDLIVIFTDSIRAACPRVAIPPCTYSEDELVRAVTVHEFGHALGLVNRKAGDGSRPVPMQSPHEDPDHPGHSDNNDSVMFWAVESSVISDLFRGGPIPTQFDANDKRDLCAAGGRC